MGRRGNGVKRWMPSRSDSIIGRESCQVLLLQKATALCVLPPTHPRRLPERRGLETRQSKNDGLGSIDAQPDGFVF